jgi:Na+/proline symporter
MGVSTAVNFGAVDYCVFVAMLGISLGIGFYHCVRGNKTTEDFLLASRSMSPVPIALSLTATFISSISILGETYGYMYVLQKAAAVNNRCSTDVHENSEL